jgi:hypothetical protein
VPAATLLRVESRELPASATRLDTVLRIRSPQGQDYLHIVAWQGDPDRTVRWRLAGYRVWFGQQEPDTPVVGTVIYLRPDADMGDRITQTIDGQVDRAACRVEPSDCGSTPGAGPGGRRAVAAGGRGTGSWGMNSGRLNSHNLPR